MGKDPAFLFYPGDWLGGTLGMNFEEKGAYLELLLAQFNKGAFTEAYAKRMLSVSQAQLWDTLKEKFETDGNLFWNGRLQEEIDKRKSYIESRRQSGLAPKKTKSIRKAYAKRSEDENKDEVINIINNVPFQKFWDLYGKKKDTHKCSAIWSKLTENEKGQIMAMLPKYLESTPDLQYRKNPLTFLNGKCWLDEVTVNTVKTNERSIPHIIENKLGIDK